MQNKDDLFNINFFEININENIMTILDTLILGCSIIIFVYDLSNEVSFNQMLRMIYKIEELEKRNNNVYKIIIGNKTDLKEDRNYCK